MSDGTRRSRLPSSGAVGFIVGGPSAESHKRFDDCVTLGFGEKLPALGSAMKGWLVVNPFTMARRAIKVLVLIQRGAAGEPVLSRSIKITRNAESRAALALFLIAPLHFQDEEPF